MSIEEFEPAVPPIHPGEIIREEFMSPLGLTAESLASALLVEAPMLARILHGDRPIPVWLAARLGRYFGNSQQFWINLQTQYEVSWWKWNDETTGSTILDQISPAVWPASGA